MTGRAIALRWPGPRRAGGTGGYDATNRPVARRRTIAPLLRGAESTAARHPYPHSSIRMRPAARVYAKVLYSDFRSGFTGGEHKPDRRMEIKIFCNCGAKYKFDVEPVNGQMPRAVVCPVCGVDGTAQANQIIRQNLTAPVAEPLGVPAPRPAMPVPQAIRLPSTPIAVPATSAPPPLPPVVRAGPAPMATPVATATSAAPPPPPVVRPGSAPAGVPPLPPVPGAPPPPVPGAAPAIRVAAAPAATSAPPPPPPVVRPRPPGTVSPPLPPPPAGTPPSSRSGYWMPAMPPVAASSKHPSTVMFDPPPVAAKSNATHPVPPPPRANS